MGCKERHYVDIMNCNREVTGSAILLNIHRPDKSTRKILIDCGLYQEDLYKPLNKVLPFNPANIDHVIVTHNHVDHTGRLPLLVKSGYNGKIHVSEPTSLLIHYALEDSYKVIKCDAKNSQQPPLYQESDVELTLSHVVAHPYEETFELEEGIKVTFFKNGHLPGAVVGLLQLSYCDYSGYQYEDINILFTGDYHNRNMFFKVPEIPQWVLDLPLTIIQECTYGDMDSTQVEHVFEENFLEAISKKKAIVIPVFSLGRSQELMYLIRQYQEQNKLDINIPVYYDGKLGVKYTALYQKDLLGLDVHDFLPKNLTFVHEPETRARIIKESSVKVVLTTSGMGSHGPAQTYLPAFLQRKDALIHFTGYVTEGTLGRRIYDCPNDGVVSAGGISVKKNADVKFTSEFSGHAKANELIYFLAQFKNIKAVLINHGSYDSQLAYSKRVETELHPKSVGVLNSQYLFRVNAYGVTKQLTTKF